MSFTWRHFMILQGVPENSPYLPKKLWELFKSLAKDSMETYQGERNVAKYYDHPLLLEEARFLGVRLYWKKLIDQIKPDILNIHGNNLDRLPMILSAVESCIPFAFTSRSTYIRRK